MFLALFLFDWGQDREREVGIPGEVFVGLVGIYLPVGEDGRHALQCRTIVHPGPKAIWEGLQKVRAFAIAFEATRAVYAEDG